MSRALPAARFGRRLLDRLLPRRRRGRGAPPPAVPAEEREDPLRSAGVRLRHRREEAGLSLRDLADRTRISTAVLEALERGWRDRLPEAAYLRTMVPLIEQQLQLPGGSLAGALPVTPASKALQARPPGLLWRFTPGSIDVFTTWQGTVLYGVLILALLYGINLQHRRRAMHLAPAPIPPLPVRAASATGAAGPSAATDPEDLARLRPLSRLETQPPLERLRRSLTQPPSATAAGRLTIRLERPSRITLEAGDAAATTLEGARGEIRLQLQPPLDLRIVPVPEGEDAVLWNGEPLRGETGRFRLPPAGDGNGTGNAGISGDPAAGSAPPGP